MKNEPYDEYQMMMRHKIGYQSFFLLVILLVVNAFVGESYKWASPSMQTFVLIIITTFIFVTRLNFSNAYENKLTKLPLDSPIFYIVFGVVEIVYFVFFSSQGTEVINQIFIQHYIPEGVLMLFTGVFFIYLGVIMFVKRFLDKREETREVKA